MALDNIVRGLLTQIIDRMTNRRFLLVCYIVTLLHCYMGV